MSGKTPKNIFEQILFGIEATNNNVVALSENLNALLSIMEAKPIDLGEETIEACETE